MAGSRNFSLLHSDKARFGIHPASNTMGSGVSFPGIKQPRREDDYSPPFRADAKNCEAKPPLPLTSS
jgi:hypothetical protein